MAERDRVAAAWDAEYAAGRYPDEMPVPFVHDILGAARARGVRSGLYIGCGNGRNFLPLVAGGTLLMPRDTVLTLTPAERNVDDRWAARPRARVPAQPPPVSLPAEYDSTGVDSRS